jgi:hypothetical protein
MRAMGLSSLPANGAEGPSLRYLICDEWNPARREESGKGVPRRARSWRWQRELRLADDASDLSSKIANGLPSFRRPGARGPAGTIYLQARGWA